MRPTATALVGGVRSKGRGASANGVKGVKTDEWGRQVYSRTSKVAIWVLAAACALVLLWVGALMVGTNTRLTAGMQAVAAFVGVLVAIALLLVTRKQLGLLDHQANIMSRQQQLLEDQDRRDRARFVVETLPGNPFRSIRSEQVVEVAFTVQNTGHKDSAIMMALVRVRHEDKEIDAWPVQSMQRDGPIGPVGDWMVRAGDRVRFRGNVVIPRDKPLGNGYIMSVRPVLWDGSNEGNTHFPP